MKVRPRIMMMVVTLAVPFVDLEPDFRTNGGVGNKAFWQLQDFRTNGGAATRQPFGGCKTVDEL